MSYKQLLLSFVLFAFGATLGCKTNLFGNQEAPVAQPAPAPAPVATDGVRTSYADIVERTSPAVVRIESDIKTKGGQVMQFPFGDDEFFRGLPMQPQQQQRPQIQRGIGSGVIVSADGTILTNNHVVEGADKIIVQTNNDKTFEAKVVGTDKPSDLAVLKIDAENLPFLTLGNSDTVRVGDIVLAIGNPLGIGQTVTAGIISAKGRRTGLSDGSFEDFLQTDAPINRGNSGGALVNLNSELIGINSQILSGGGSGGNIGIGFSIPSNMAKSVMDQLLKDGKVHRGQLGVRIQNITEDLAKAFELKDTKGVIVSEVIKGGASDKAGMKRDDIITAVNGESVEDTNILRNKIAGTAPGTAVKLTIVRDGNQQDISVTLDEFNVEQAMKTANDQDQEQGGAEKQNGKLGLSLQPVTPGIARQLGVSADQGLVVTDIDPTGPAAEAGLARGDVVLEINKTAVSSIDDVQAALQKAGSKPILLLISRRGQTVYLTVRP